MSQLPRFSANVAAISAHLPPEIAGIAALYAIGYASIELCRECAVGHLDASKYIATNLLRGRLLRCCDIEVETTMKWLCIRGDLKTLDWFSSRFDIRNQYDPCIVGAYIIEHNHMDCLYWLCDQWPDMSILSDLLEHACKCGDITAVDILINDIQDCKIIDEYQLGNCLIVALDRGYYTIASLVFRAFPNMIKIDYDVYMEDDSDPSLETLVWLRCMFKKQHDANVNTIVSHDNIRHAVQMNNINVANWLIRQHFNVHGGGDHMYRYMFENILVYSNGPAALMCIFHAAQDRDPKNLRRLRLTALKYVRSHRNAEMRYWLRNITGSAKIVTDDEYDTIMSEYHCV